MQFQAKDIAELIGGEVFGDVEAVVTGVSKIDKSAPNTISFLSNPKYVECLYDAESSVVIVNRDIKLDREVKPTLIKVDDAYMAIATLLEMYEQMKPKKVGIEKPSYISESAKVGDRVYIGAFAYLGEDVKIGDGVKIYPNSYIGDGVTVADNTTIFAGVKIYSGCKIGSGSIIHAGAVIGSDGFGFAPNEDGSYKKIAQVGGVVVGDDVEIGANSTIDCGTMDPTVIENGVKIDNLVHIAHNVTVGEHTAMAAQVGVAGSATIGKRCVFGGQTAINGHIKVCDDVKVGGKSGVMHNTHKPGEYFGMPILPVKEELLRIATGRRVPAMRSEMKSLGKRVDALESK